MSTVIVGNGATRSLREGYMYQVFFGKVATFKFPASPVEVSFESVSSAYDEISRPQNFPILAFSEFQLMKASIEFRLFDRGSGGANHVQSQILLLQGMALLPAPVWFSYVDAMLVHPVGGSVNTGLGGKRPYLLWRISDMTANTVRRDRNNRSTQIDVKLTLIEERNQLLPSVLLPKITYDPIPPRKTSPPSSRGKTSSTARTAKGVTSTGTRASGGNQNTLTGVAGI